MTGMFQSASAFNGDISRWDVSSVYTMQYMFKDARQFDKDISGWKTTKLAFMEKMFYNASNFKYNISSWDLSNVHNISIIEDISSVDKDNVFRNSGVGLGIIKEFYYEHRHKYRKRIKSY